MKTQIEQTAILNRITIDHLAWQLWEEEGRPMGRDQEYWARAERLLAAREQRKGETLDETANCRWRTGAQNSAGT